MSEAHRRRKDPDAVRANLIAAAAELLAHGEPLSMGSVAELAGVTKGAVQHHFGTREQLLSDMCDTYMQQFQTELSVAREGDTGPGSAARAYVRATLHGFDEASEQAHWRAILVAAVIDRAVAERWSSWVAENRAGDAAKDNAELIMRLAADGLWLSDLLGVYKLTASQRASLGESLLAMSSTEAHTA